MEGARYVSDSDNEDAATYDATCSTHYFLTTMKPIYQRLNLCDPLPTKFYFLLTFFYRFIDGQDAYTFVPVQPIGAQSLTIHRATGDIVLNGELPLTRGIAATYDSAQHRTHLSILPPRDTARQFTGSWG